MKHTRSFYIHVWNWSFSRPFTICNWKCRILILWEEEREEKMVRMFLFVLLEDLKAIGGYLEPWHSICISISRRHYASMHTWVRETLNPRDFFGWILNFTINFSVSIINVTFKKMSSARKIMWKIKAAKSHVGWFHSNNLKLVRIDNHDTNYTNFHRHCLE